MTDLHKRYTMEEVQNFILHFKEEKISLLDECHDCLTDAINLLEGGPVDEKLVLVHSQIKDTINSIEKYTKELMI